MSMTGTTHRDRGASDRNLPVAVGTGVALAALALILFSLGPGYAMILVTAVITVAAVEFFTALRGIGYSPATLLGIVATASIVLAAYWRGEAAYPLVLFLLIVFGLLWYLLTGPHEHITTNLGVTVLAVAWIGVLGAFAALMLDAPEHGTGMLLATIIATVAYDVGGLFIGGSAGRAPLAPTVSPNKTVEGLVGGMGAAILVGVVIGFIGLAPWESAGDGLLLGIVVAVAAPLGDLCESLIKRDLGLKDMGTVLPGHGGLLDRFDALLFTLPAAYYLARLLDLVPGF
jgi:phosphatidate cytidylyltransferase